jgi:hypothetical protein
VCFSVGSRWKLCTLVGHLDTGVTCLRWYVGRGGNDLKTVRPRCDEHRQRSFISRLARHCLGTNDVAACEAHVLRRRCHQPYPVQYSTCRRDVIQKAPRQPGLRCTQGGEALDSLTSDPDDERPAKRSRTRARRYLCQPPFTPETRCRNVRSTSNPT